MPTKASLFFSVLIATIGLTALLYGVIASASLTAAYDTLLGVGNTASSSTSTYIAAIPNLIMYSYAIAAVGFVITLAGVYAVFATMSDLGNKPVRR